MKALTKVTRSIKPAEVEKKWHVIDADGLVAQSIGGGGGLIGFAGGGQANPLEFMTLGGAGAGGIFPFRFRGQPVGGAGLLRQPGGIGLGIVPGGAHDRRCVALVEAGDRAGSLAVC